MNPVLLRAPREPVLARPDSGIKARQVRGGRQIPVDALFRPIPVDALFRHKSTTNKMRLFRCPPRLRHRTSTPRLAPPPLGGLTKYTIVL